MDAKVSRHIPERKTAGTCAYKLAWIDLRQNGFQGATVAETFHVDHKHGSLERHFDAVDDVFVRRLRFLLLYTRQYPCIIL